MKGDFSRQTFVPAKHYAGVLMQQGRVAVDADWNEQQDIVRHRVETETRDVVGRCGTPLEPPSYQTASGFEITLAQSDKTFSIGRGRYYAGGLLAENENPVAYGDQSKAPYELPAPPAAVVDLLNANQAAIVYLDVWQRHVTPLEDPLIREQALGEADTATRMRTSWQVKVLPLAGAVDVSSCGATFPEWDTLVAPPTGRMKAFSNRPTTTPDPCEPPPSAGYVRLENQLYRVEIHRTGTAAAAGGATFKWSRENGSIATEVTGFPSTNPPVIEVASLGRDTELGFADGQWVELFNDDTELDTTGAKLGQLTRIHTIVDADKKRIQLVDAPRADLKDATRHPRLRRWDQVHRPSPAPDPVVVTANGVDVRSGVSVPLEDGVRVEFAAGTYRSGDYWLVPARTAVGDVEWPRNGSGPAFLPPVGTRHYYCRLALIRRTGAKLELVADCRDKFAPLTETATLLYVGGDGQETMPGEAFEQPLEVGVFRGRWPVAGARVQFTVEAGGGLGATKSAAEAANAPITLDLTTGSDGIARCFWKPDPDLSDATQTNWSQRATAQLLGVGNALLPPLVNFNGTLSTAERVAYKASDQCSDLVGAETVKEALDVLCLRGDGGCAVTVHPHQRLDKVIKGLLDAGEKEICICLTGGVHKLPQGLQINATDVHLRISGCGPGTRLVLGKTALVKVRTVSIRTLEAIVEKPGPGLGLVAGDVVVESCGFRHLAPAANHELIGVRAADFLRIVDNVIDAHLVQKEQPLSGVTDLVKLEDLGAARLGTVTLAEQLSRTKSARTKMRREIRDARSAINKLSETERRAYADLDAVLADDARTDEIQPALVAVVVTAVLASAGAALAIEAAASEAVVADNQIIGEVTLYGGPITAGGLPLTALPGLRKAQDETRLTLAGTGTLHVRDNSLTTFGLEKGVRADLNRAATAGGAAKLTGLFRSIHLTDNTLVPGPPSKANQVDNVIVAPHVVLTSNRYDQEKIDVGAIIADAAVYTGNSAPDPVKLFSVARTSAAAANLTLNLVAL